MIPIIKGKFEALQPNAAYWPGRLKQAVAVCNGLTWVSRNTVAGDSFDRKLFSMVEAHFVVSICMWHTVLVTLSTKVINALKGKVPSPVLSSSFSLSDVSTA